MLNNLVTLVDLAALRYQQAIFVVVRVYFVFIIIIILIVIRTISLFFIELFLVCLNIEAFKAFITTCVIVFVV